jgi:hypothetical protein
LLWSKRPCSDILMDPSSIRHDIVLLSENRRLWPPALVRSRS